MNFVKRYFWITHLVFAITVFGLGFFVGGINKDVNVKDNSISEGKSYTMLAKTEENLNEATKKEETVTADTKFVFIRKYAYDSSTNVSEKKATSEYIGKTKEEIKKMFTGWELVSFSKEKVVFSSAVDYYPEGTYLLSTYVNENNDEVVSVYSYDADGNKHLYQMFDTPINMFDEETVTNLRKGIPAKSQDELEKLMQDYE